MKNQYLRLTLLSLLLTAPFWSAAQNTPALKNTPTLTLELAARMMEVATRRATELNSKVCIAIIGGDGLPLTIRRHEEAPGFIYQQALEQAQSAWLDNTGPGLSLAWNQHRIGGIGVSGASEKPSREIATAALDVFNHAIKKKLPVEPAPMELLKIILYVKPSKMEEASTFYREDLNLQQVTTFDNWIEFEAGTVSLCLSEKREWSRRDKATNFALYSGTREEVEALYGRLIEKGYKVTSDINPERDKTIGRLRHEELMTTFWIKDPAGNTVQIESLRTR